MNTPISLVIPMPSIIIQFPFNHQSINDFHALCENCRRNNSSLINEKKEVKTDEKIICVKDEAKDFKPNNNYFKEEYYATLDTDERLFNNNTNMDARLFSPISVAYSTDTESRQVYASEHHDEGYDFTIKQSFRDTSDIVEYLKQDLMN